MKITIEVDGQKLVVPEEMIVTPRLSLLRESVEVPCDCPTDCNAVHRRLTGRGSFELKADLTGQPLWVG